MNVLKLRGKIVEKNFKTSSFANALGIPKSTLYRGFNTGNFTIETANKIVEVLELTKDEASSIFFDSIVA